MKEIMSGTAIYNDFGVARKLPRGVWQVRAYNGRPFPSIRPGGSSFDRVDVKYVDTKREARKTLEELEENE